MLQQQETKTVSPWIDTSQFRNITDLLELNEGQILDFKSARIEPRDLVEILVAFATADGGTAVINMYSNVLPRTARNKLIQE